jgi:hypothetical protein
MLLIGLIIAGSISGIYFWRGRHAVPPTEIYHGIVYGCELLESGSEARGLMHWVRVDLTSPGIELYVTPLDPEAVAKGWQYRLQRTGNVVRKEQLAVAVNGTVFTSDSGWIPMAGDLARSMDTTVADHQVGRGGDHTHLLWFDDELMPYIEPSRGPSAAVLRKARWGIGGQSFWLTKGQVSDWAERTPVDARTVVGINRQEQQLFLAVFEGASPHRALEKLAELGAVDGMLLDSGDSTCMALGENNGGVRAGVLLQGWRPVATHFGVRAKPVEKR